MSDTPRITEPSNDDALRTSRMRDRALFGLSLDYTIVFILDLDTDEYEIVFTQATNHAQANAISTYTAYVQDYAERFVVPEQQATFCHELNFKTIRERFKTQKDYHYSFETVPNAAELSHFQAHIVQEFDQYGRFAFLGFRSVDEVVRRERYYQEQLEQANRELEQQLDMITKALPGGVKISNDDEMYTFKYVSEQFAQMLGYDSPEELTQAAHGSIVGLAYPDDVETAIADALTQYERSDNYATTYRVRCKDGSYKYIEDRGRKFVQEDGTVEHWNLVLDKNELMQKTIELESERRANQAKTEFLSRMSHDMRTPLNGIIGLLDICARHPEDRQLVDASREKAIVASEHLQSLINDTLELSKLESNESALYEEKFDAPELFRQVATIASMRADAEGIKITYGGTDMLKRCPCLMGSPLYIKQIALNLINNAIRYNRPGGSVACDLDAHDNGDGRLALEMTISDTGIGMSQEFLESIFKPFVQADRGPRSTYTGTGLGMAIVKNLVDRMGGTIDIQSTLGEGTTARVALPFKLAHGCGASRPASVQQRPSSLTGRRVLLVEDNELSREITTFILEDEGASVVEATDGQEALSLYRDNPAHHFDAVLMDIMMPSMDGYEATRAIRSCGKDDSKTVPIIALTANAFDDDRQRSMAAGMNRHLAKPIDPAMLVRTIGDLCAAK